MHMCSAVWNPVGDGNKGLGVKLESVQRKAARYVFNDWRKTSSVSAMINNLGWTLLEEKRKISNLLMLHKIINQKVDIPLSFLPNNRDHLILDSNLSLEE